MASFSLGTESVSGKASFFTPKNDPSKSKIARGTDRDALELQEADPKSVDQSLWR